MYYKVKPFRDYSEHDVVNLFALDTATGALGTLVKITGSGFVNNQSHGIAFNLNTSNPNVFTPRWEVKAKVTRTNAGEKPLGFILYDVKEKGFLDRPLIWDEQRKIEAQAVVSGDANPIVRRGMWLVGGFPTGTGDLAPMPGRVTVAGPSGDWAIAAAGTANAFGVILGAPDAQGYALVELDFNNF